MKPDELRALAETLNSIYAETYAQREAIDSVVAYLRACADAKPVAWMALAYGLPSQATTDEPTAIRWRKAGGDVVPLYTHPAPQPQPEKCGCRSCLTPAERLCTFVVCPKCGDKRCPRADDHRNACTDSNDQPQPERQPVSEPMDAEAWAELHRLRAEAKGPDGYATWKEAAVSERIRRVRAEKQLTERQPVSEPTRSEKRRAAGFTRRDDRIECDECGKKFTPQMLPIHKCEPTEATEQMQSLVEHALRLQETHYGDGASLHIHMIAWAEKARAALAAKE